MTLIYLLTLELTLRCRVLQYLLHPFQEAPCIHILNISIQRIHTTTVAVAILMPNSKPVAAARKQPVPAMTARIQ